MSRCQRITSAPTATLANGCGYARPGTAITPRSRKAHICNLLTCMTLISRAWTESWCTRPMALRRTSRSSPPGSHRSTCRAGPAASYWRSPTCASSDCRTSAALISGRKACGVRRSRQAMTFHRITETGTRRHGASCGNQQAATGRPTRGSRWSSSSG